MTRVVALFDNGANGDSITPQNSGVTSVSALNGNTAVLSTAAAWHGGLGGLFTTINGGNVAGAFATLNYATDDIQQTFSAVVRTPAAYPSTDMTIVNWRDAANQTIMRVFFRASDNGLYITDAGGSTYTLIDAATDYNLNTKYRLTVTSQVGTTTSNGSFMAKLRRVTDQTQIGVTASSSTANLGTVAYHRVIVGIFGNNPGYTIGIDDLQIDSGTTTELGDYAPPANQYPIVNAGADQTTPVGVNLTRTADAMDPDGTIATQQWVSTTRPGGVTTPTFPAGGTFTYNYPQPGTYVFTFTATDNQGASTSDTVTVTAVAASNPTAAVNQTIGPGIIDARASTAGSGGTLTYTISPAGPVQITAGCWYAAPGVTDVTYTVTVTESGTGASDTETTVVTAAGGATGYTGTPVTLTLPTPNDPSTDDSWGGSLNTEINKLVARLNDVITFLN